MAEVALAAGVSMFDAVVGALRAAVVESFGVPGARIPARLARWIEDTPELKLNLSLLAEAFLQLLASGLGTLALVWATVVLLGGFSTMLVTTDFWCITAIVFVETARIVGYNSAPEAKFFVDLLAALSRKDISRVRTATKFVRLLTLGPTWIALAPVFLATACMSLSTIRLAGISRHDYGADSTSSADACRNANMKPALILFYALVLTQGVLFLLWFVVAAIRSWLSAELNFLYLGQLSGRSRKQLIGRYVSSIADTCIQKGVATTINTNLVSFAAELLFQTQHPDDHTSAVIVLHSLVIKSQNRSDGAVEQICSSEKLVYRLVRMLCSDELDVDIKEKNAKIVAKLACKLRLADMPRAAHCISSLLDPHLMKKAAQISASNYYLIDLLRSEMKAPLFLHGLVILGELTTDPDNCREIYSTMDLVPKIIAPVTNGLHIVIKDDKTTVEIVRESLGVLAKLTSGTSDSSRKLCHELTTKYGRTADNIIWILSNSRDQGMRMLAVEILSRLTLDEPIISNFTAELRRLLLDPDEDSQLRIEAGKALIARGDEFPDIQQLVAIMSADAAYSKEYRAVIAEMLAQICAKSTADQDRINRLSSVANALSTVLKAIVTATTNITEIDSSNRKFLASLLGLAVQIREKLVTPETFADAVTGLPMGNNIFAETLKRIIKMAKKREDEIFLAIMKSATKLVTWMAETDTISPGYYIEYFRRESIVQKLDAAVMAMAHLERYLVMTGGADEKEGYVTLQTLVETAKNKLVPQQQQG